MNMINITSMKRQYTESFHLKQYPFSLEQFYQVTQVSFPILTVKDELSSLAYMIRKPTFLAAIHFHVFVFMDIFTQCFIFADCRSELCKINHNPILGYLYG